MRRISAVVLALGIVLTLVGCDKQLSQPQTDGAQPKYDWGLSLSVKNVTPTGATLVISQSNGTPSGELRYGLAYKIQYLNGETWEDLPYATEADVAWTEEAYIVEMDSDCEVELSWDWLYGNLTSGQYRIVKQFMDFRSSGDYDNENYYANFEIEK